MSGMGSIGHNNVGQLVGGIKPQEATPAQVSGGEKSSWKASVAEFFSRAVDAIKHPVDTIKGLFQRNLSSSPAPNEARASATGDPNISSPTLQKKFDAPIMQDATLKSLPKTLTDSVAFKLEMAELKEAIQSGNDTAIQTHMAKLGLLVSDQFGVKGGIARSAQMQFTLSNGAAFKASLAEAMGMESLGSLGDAAFGKMYGSLVQRTSDRQLPSGNLMINGFEYQNVKTLASGNFGSVEVYRALPGQDLKGAPQELAVKTPKANDFQGAVMTPMQEAKNLINMQGTGASEFANRFAQFEGAVHASDGKLLIAMQYEEGGTAKGVVNSAAAAFNKGEITQDQYFDVILTVMKSGLEGGVQMQDGKGMIHLDLKGDNWLINQKGEVKLADPGLAVRVSETPGEATKVPNMLPFAWMSPEALAHNPDTNSASDVWNMGIVLNEFRTGSGMMNPLSEHPLLDGTPSNPLDLMNKVKAFGQQVDGTLVKPTGNESAREKSMIDLINRMTAPNPADRPTFQEVLNHPLMKGLKIGSPETQALLQSFVPKPPPTAQPTPPAMQSIYVGDDAYFSAYSDNAVSELRSLPTQSSIQGENYTLVPKTTTGDVFYTTQTDPLNEGLGVTLSEPRENALTGQQRADDYTQVPTPSTGDGFYSLQSNPLASGSGTPTTQPPTENYNYTTTVPAEGTTSSPDVLRSEPVESDYRNVQ
jgi:serine/threonine protein kinase